MKHPDELRKDPGTVKEETNGEGQEGEQATQEETTSETAGE